MLSIRYLIVSTIICFAFLSASDAAEQEFVGVVAIALEKDVAKELKLNSRQIKALEDLAAIREDNAIDLAMRLKDLPAEEQKKKLAPFRKESERLGLEILNKRQRAALLKIQEEREPKAVEKNSAVKKTVSSAESAASSVESSNVPEAKMEKAETEKTTEPVEKEPTESTSVKEVMVKPVVSKEVAPEDAELKESVSSSEAIKSLKGTNKPAAPAVSDGKLRFSFSRAEWREVIKWFADKNGLSLLMDESPPGTFNYTDPHGYSPKEALDLINSVLLMKNFTLVHRNNMLVVVNIAKGIPDNLVPFVPLKNLESRGKYELVKTVFTLNKMDANTAKTEIQSLWGPQGDAKAFQKSRQLEVRSTAGRLIAIRDVIDSIEHPGKTRGDLKVFSLEHRIADEVMPVLRQMLGMPEETNALPDGSLKIAIDLSGRRLIVQGDGDKLLQLGNILKLVDIPGPEGTSASIEQPVLKVYSTSGADPESVLAVLQTLLAGDPDTRLQVDESGNLYALARPTQHKTIIDTIAQSKKDGRVIKVIPLYSIDPQTAVLAINDLFGATGETPDPKAPKVTGDITTRSLLVRASAAQILQIEGLLKGLGEVGAESGVQPGRGNVRILPLTGRSARGALYQLEQIWPTMRKNKIQVKTPSDIGIPTFSPSGNPSMEESAFPDNTEGGFFQNSTPSRNNRNNRPSGKNETRFTPIKKTDANRPGASASRASRLQVQFASQPGAGASDKSDTPDPKVIDELSKQPQIQIESPTKPGAVITVVLGPAGVIIASEDLDALDDFEELLTTISNRSSKTGREFVVYLLRYTKATFVAETLNEIFNGTGGGGGGGGGLMGDIAGAALGGGAGGDLMSGLLGLGGGGSSSLGAIDIVADSRLNALIVRGKSEDLDVLEQLLKIIDQDIDNREVETEPEPRLIPVFNSSAQYVASVLEITYKDKIRSSGGQQKQPSPQDLIRALRGGKGGGAGNNDKAREELNKMTIAVDTNSNSLIVRAQDPLFKEVVRVVEKIDNAESNLRQSTTMVSLKNTNSSSVQSTLQSIFGDSIQFNQQSNGRTRTPSSSASRNSRTNATQNSIRMMQQFQNLRGLNQRGGRPGQGGNTGRSGRGNTGRGSSSRGGQGTRGGGQRSGGRR